MDIHSGSIRCRGILAVAALTAGFSMHTTRAAESASSQNLHLSGTATLRIDQPAQTSGSLSLRAHLTAKDAALASSSPVQERGRFVIMGRLVAAAQVCYNDTIFRDDFDGDGG